MKNVLLASAALAAMTAAAYADGHEGGVSVTGDGRMGLVYDDTIEDNEFGFNSRLRIKFAASGETDAGLKFGGDVRADNAGSGADGLAGKVFISGEFGKLSMGDVDGAAKAAVGHVDGVGYVNQGDTNESTYVANAGRDEAALYEYSAGDFGFKFSVANPRGTAGVAGSPAVPAVLDDPATPEDESAAAIPAVEAVPADDAIAYALGLTYAINDITLALGYEDNDANVTHIIVGATAAFGDITVKGIVGQADLDGTNETQFALSATYDAGGSSYTAFYTDDSDLGGLQAVGLGASYDLGGGAKLKGGIAQTEDAAGADATIADFGLTFDF